MAISRFGKHSDVYLWPREFGEYECQLCSLGTGSTVLSGRVVEHLETHVDAGDEVTDWAMRRAVRADSDEDFVGMIGE